MLKRITVVGVGMAMLFSPILVSAQSQDSSDANSTLVALLTQLVQTLEQELAALESALQNNSSGQDTQGSSSTTSTTQTTGAPATGGALTATPASGSSPLSVAFSTTPLNANDSYELDLGDGTTVAMISGVCNQIAGSGAACQYQATHSYASVGSYVVVLYQVSGQDNGVSLCTPQFLAFCGQAMGTVTITVTGATQGSPAITYVSNSGGSVTGSYANLPAGAQIVVINVTSNQPVSGVSASVSGSGTVTLNNLPLGTFYLKAQDSSGNYLAQSVNFTATGGTSTTTFTATPSSGSAPLAVSFSGSLPGATATSTYTINFGDGQTGAVTIGFGDCAIPAGEACTPPPPQLSASHTYTGNGTYNAILMDGSGNTISTVTVTVGGTPSSGAFFIVSLSGGVAPLSTTFIAGGLTDPNSTYAIDFGDNTNTNVPTGLGGSGTNNAPVNTVPIHCTAQNTTPSTNGIVCSGSLPHIYTQAGTFIATLYQYPNVATTCTSFSLANCSGKAIGTITITVTAGTPGQQTSSFFATPSAGTAPLAVTFMASQGTRVLFGDGNSGTLSPSASGCVYSTAAVNPYNCYGSVQYTYSIPGTYTAQLVDANGNIIGRLTISVGAQNSTTF